MIHCYTNASARIGALITRELRSACGSLDPRRIVIKPNWVLHESEPAFPIQALVTDARVIQATVDACLGLFPRAESILIGDCPLQYADWPLMCHQSGLDECIQSIVGKAAGRVVFRDLRREVFVREGASRFLSSGGEPPGDPRGYREIDLGRRSHLEPLADQAKRFAVNDYSAAVTRSNHAPGSHRYVVSQSILDADLFINLPKWKSHQKTAITCALKNVVGINGDKACLPHFRRGAPAWGGDEYRDDSRWLYWLQTHLRERFQKRSRLMYHLLKPGWELVKRLRGIQTHFSDPKAKATRFYLAGGAWHGNDTLWRTIYDLNLIIQCADANGQLHDTPQRAYACVVDGLNSGEGNGPLEPLPRKTDWLAFGDDPFAIDAALAWFMGFDPARIPLVARRSEFLGPGWGRFGFEDLVVDIDGHPIKAVESEINFWFLPPPGWLDYVERRSRNPQPGAGPESRPSATVSSSRGHPRIDPVADHP